jgi:O-antigen ligase
MIGLAHIGGPVSCLGLALLLVARSRRDRLAGLGFATFGALLLAAALDPSRPWHVVAETAAALAVAAVAAVVFRRVPWLVPLAALACVPVRIGALGHQLLVPLYVVVAAATLVLFWEIARGDERSRELGFTAWPLAAYVGWTGISLAWSQDLNAGATELLAFYVPFVVLAITVARMPWSRLGAGALYVEVTIMAIVFAAVAFYQYDTRNVFENPKVIVSNAYASFFRVNSVFWDPSVYGRFLVVALVPSIVLIVRGRSLRLAWAAVAVVVVTWLGLLISFSQSSFAALLVAVVGVAVVAWRWRSLIAVGLAVVVVAALAISAPQIRHSIEHHTTSGLNSASSGRASLVANGIRIAEAHPLLGVGVGGFQHAYAARVDLKGKRALSASHDTPVTVAAETGGIGLVLFVWLLASLLLQGFRRTDRTLVGGTALVAALTLAAILCHSLFYADFFEDPTTWLLLGLVGLATGRAGREAVPA